MRKLAGENRGLSPGRAPAADPAELLRLARESGELLGELGVRAEDGRWIREQAETIASLRGDRARRSRVLDYFRRLARRAARTAR